MMRKIVTILIIILNICSVFTGCAINPSYKTPDQLADEQSAQIIKCFENNDVENLKKMFCKKISETHDLDKEIREVFNCFDGKIISYDKPKGSSGGATIKYGETLEKELRGHISNIRTDTGKIYNIGIASYQIYKEDSDLVGVVVIDLRDSENKSCATIGGWEKTGIING